MKKSLVTRVSSQVHNQLKHACVDLNVTMQEFVAEAINEKLANKSTKPKRTRTNYGSEVNGVIYGMIREGRLVDDIVETAMLRAGAGTKIDPTKLRKTITIRQSQFQRTGEFGKF